MQVSIPCMALNVINRHVGALGNLGNMFEGGVYVAASYAATISALVLEFLHLILEILTLKCGLSD